MAVDSFLKIGTIEGESKDFKYKGWTDVLAHSMGMSNAGTFGSGGGGGAGKVNIQDVSCVIKVEKTIPDLMLHCSNGKHIGEVKIISRKAGENPLEYQTIIMKDVLVTSVQVGGSEGQEEHTANVTFNSAKISFHYIEQTPQGGEGAKPKYDWDTLANQAV